MLPPKKTRRGTAGRPKAPVAGSVPDRQTLETFFAALTAADERDDALSKAQNLIYDAWERRTSRSRIALARKALALSPLCADAYNVLAAEAKTPEEARDFYLEGVAAGERALGPDWLEEYGGRFWGFLETRPYMRARHGLARTLLALGEEPAALDHFRAILELNPNDNQGIRYLLLAGLIRTGDMAGAKALLTAYAEDGSADWTYSLLLIAYLEGKKEQPSTRTLLKNALSSNVHVAAMLAGTSPPALNQSGYVTMGGPDEATDYVREFGAAWRAAPGAIAWLMDATGGSAEARAPRARRRKGAGSG